ncbi:MAG: hypothetical protein ABEI27_10125 [Halobellus sp.]|uniref:hypothetical protein n=1 Tax=Halobellus sp. TaxID=1979212 RepID=UPI0035D4965F
MQAEVDTFDADAYEVEKRGPTEYHAGGRVVPGVERAFGPPRVRPRPRPPDAPRGGVDQRAAPCVGGHVS